MHMIDLAPAWGIEEYCLRKPVTFIKGDNMQFLRWCKDEMMRGYFHVGIVDPPYGISVGDMKLGATKDSKPRSYEMGDWDSEVPTAEYWELLRYCCRNLIVWGGNYFTKELDWSGRAFYVWDKKGGNMSFADCELALTTFDGVARIINRSRNVKNNEDVDKRHPTQKPVYIYDYLHLKHVNRGERVLDTHGGSMSHAVAAYKNNVCLTILERDTGYFKRGIEYYDGVAVKGRLAF